MRHSVVLINRHDCHYFYIEKERDKDHLSAKKKVIGNHFFVEHRQIQVACQSKMRRQKDTGLDLLTFCELRKGASKARMCMRRSARLLMGGFSSYSSLTRLVQLYQYRLVT